MKKVLSIDLDYIASPDIDLHQQIEYHSNPSVRWNMLSNHTNTNINDINIDTSNLLFTYKLFLKALRASPDASVSFGFEHDAIMYSIKDFTDIHLVHIDHHDDFLHGEFVELDTETSIEYTQISENNYLNEGNWIGWLHSKNKLSNYIWISNPNSLNEDKNSFISKLVPHFYCVTKEQVDFSSYDFDHIFVCLSPQYIPPQYWHYFTMFMIAYEEITGNSSESCWITDKKYTYEHYYNDLTNRLKIPSL